MFQKWMRNMPIIVSTDRRYHERRRQMLMEWTLEEKEEIEENTNYCPMCRKKVR